MSSFFEPVRVARSLAAAAALAAALVSPAHALGVSGQGTWETTLQGRDLDGDLSNGFEAYYDTDLDVTWLANASITSNVTWNQAQAFLQNLNVNGVTGWRLPDVKPVNGIAVNYRYSTDGSTDVGYNNTSTQNELAHLFYVSLGNKAYIDTSGQVQSGNGVTNSGPFSAVEVGGYWLGLPYAYNPGNHWAFYTHDGALTFNGGGTGLAVWAVHSGDVGSPVPEPQTYALWLLGLTALAMARKRGRC